MSDSTYIQDDFGNRIPLLDEHGNLSVQVIMLYTEDKLTEADRKTVADLAATDPLAADALEGYAVVAHPARTRQQLNLLNADIQRRTGASAINDMPRQHTTFNYRKLAAAVALLLLIGGGTYYGARYFSKTEMAENRETSGDERGSAAPVSPTPEEPESSKPAPVRAEAQQEQTTAPVENAKTTPPPPADNKLQDAVTPQAPVVAEKPSERKEKAEKSTADVSAQPAAKKLSSSAPNKTRVAQESDDDHASLAAKDVDEEAHAAGWEHPEVSPQQEEAAEEKELAAQQLKSERTKAQKRTNTESRGAAEQADKNGARSAYYPGGDMAMYKFVERKKIYTEAMKALDLKGTVTIAFEITEEGRIDNANVKKGADGLLNEDALRVVRSMPRWNAATDATGTPVRSSRSVVIKYGQ